MEGILLESLQQYSAFGSTHLTNMRKLILPNRGLAVAATSLALYVAVAVITGVHTVLLAVVIGITAAVGVAVATEL